MLRWNGKGDYTMDDKNKKWSILDGIELSDPEEMEELEALGALIDGPSYTLDGKEILEPDEGPKGV